MRSVRRLLAGLAALAALFALAVPAAAAAGPDLAVSISGSPDPVDAGAKITYSIQVANNGDAAASSVTVSDTVPTGTTFDSATAPQGWTVTGTSTVIFSKSALGPGETAQLTLVVTVDPNAPPGTQINDSTHAGTTSPEINLSNNDASTTTTVGTPDLAVTNADSPDPVAPGHDLTYDIGIANTGTRTAQGVAVKETMPSKTTFVSATAPTGWTIASPAAGSTGDVTFTRNAVPPGYSASFTVVVHVNPGTAEGTSLSATASATSSTPESNLSNNSATTTARVSMKSDLVVTNSASPGSVSPDADITYAVTVANRGAVDAHSVTLADPVPRGTRFVSAAQTGGPAFGCSTPAPGAGGTVICGGGTLAPGTMASFRIVVHVPTGAPPGTIQDTASASTTTAQITKDSNSAKASTAVVAPPGPGARRQAADLAVIVPARAAQVRRGGTKAIRVTVKNKGSLAARNARLLITVPPGLSLVSATARLQTCSGRTRVTCSFGFLQPGESASVRLVLSTHRAGRFRLPLTASSSGADSNRSNNSAAIAVRVL
jgi:uncharacterized repeat protein (TIGR01451 family)